MTSPLQMPDFFVLEAGESLDRLDTLVRPDTGPPPDEFLRVVRLLRGSALMAGQQPIARAASGLEALARAYRERPDAWSVAVREQVIQAIEEFRVLIRRVREWGEPETARAVRLGRSLDALAGPRGDQAATEQGAREALHTGVRAFVAREGALVASALDRAARALRAAPGDREPLYAVIRRMQSLRGLGELGELMPLPSILDGIELAVGDLTRMFAPPPGVDEVIDAAARAITRIARDVAERGHPDPESPETQQFTELLVRVFAVERDVVPIESLYIDGDTNPLQRPVVDADFRGPEALGPLELVSHGEHLCQTAELLAQSHSSTVRDLRLYQLLGTLRSVGPSGADPVAAALGVFARATREALAAGVASRATDALVVCLRDAGELLRGVADTDDRMMVSRRLLDVAHRLDTIREPQPDDADVLPIEQLLLPEEQTEALPVVPIESLAPDDRSAGDSTTLETTARTYTRLLRERGTTTPSVAAFLGREWAREETPVAIEQLCYRGRAALERAGAVRQQLAIELGRNAELPVIRPLLEELLDLVPLAMTDQ